MTQLATMTMHGTVAVVTLDSPPVNALSTRLRAAACAALGEALAAPGCAAVVLTCAGSTFIAGADISEFDQAEQEPSFDALLALVEDAAVPVVAAIHGTALGGGFELALACHYRVAVAGARVGLPEVHLGILPGAGGTQRLPRLTGAATALDIITSGRHVGAAEAHELGMIDAIVPGDDLVGGAIAFAEQVIAAGAARPRVRDREDRIAADRGQPGLFAAFLEKNAARFKRLAAPQAIVEAVAAAVDLPFEAGLARELELFHQLVKTPQSAALRHLFFAERRAGQVPDLPAGTPLVEIRSVGVIGAGTMGGGITMNFLNAGIPVILVETTQAALDRGIGVIRRNYEASARKGRMSEAEVEARMALITPALELGALADCDLVIEAVYESMAVKIDVFTRLDAIAKPGAILASNTSFLDLDRIAAATARPEWVVGLHFFSPANVMRLLEVVRGAKTSPTVIATAMRLARRIRKVAVLSGVCDGFIANRLLAPRGYQAEAMMLEGVPIAAIDRVLTDYGFAMGHFQMMDLVGLDAIGRDATERTVMGDLVAAGRLGQKSGAGYYDYDERRRPSASAVTEAMIGEVAAARGVASAPVPDEAQLLARLLYPVVNEGAKILEEGIALRASDIDVAAVLGYNWPAYRGGPMQWADAVGLPAIVAGLEALAAAHGPAFAPAALLRDLAASGRRFAQAG